MLQHLTPDEVERFANARLGPAPSGSPAEHLSQCRPCREEVDVVRALAAHLVSLSEISPSRDFAQGVLGRLDFPELQLDYQLAALERVSPSPAFAAEVMSQVRLPVAWPARVSRLVKRRRTAFATAAAATFTIMGAGTAWLFGAQGVTPGQVVAFAFGSVRDLATEALLALGQAGYQAGLVDAGGSITNQISPTTALGGLCLASVLGLASLWVMTRLSRAQPQPAALVRAA